MLWNRAATGLTNQICSLVRSLASRHRTDQLRIPPAAL